MSTSAWSYDPLVKYVAILAACIVAAALVLSVPACIAWLNGK